VEGARLFDRIVAGVALAVGVLCLRAAWLALPLPDAGAAGGAPLLSYLRIAALLLGGIACVVSAARLWSARRAGPATADAQRFGRDAQLRPATHGRPHPLLFVVPLLVAGAFAADSVIGLPPEGQGIELPLPPAATQPGDGQTAEAPPAAPAEPPPVVPPAVAPEAPPAPPSGPDTAWPDLVPPAGLASPPPMPPVEVAEPPPEVVEPPAPPQTTAPLPTPPQQATQADGHHEAVVWLSVSPDGHSIMTASTDRMIKLWDLDNRTLIRDVGAHKDMARTALFLPDGARALTAGDDGEVVLRNLADGAVLHVFSATQHGGANEVELSPDGRIAVSGHEAGTVIVWDIEKRAVVHVMAGHDWPIVSTAVSADATKAITGSIDGTLKLWDIQAGKLIRSWLGHERGTYGAAFTADSRQVVTGSGDYTIKIWDVVTGDMLRRFDGHSGTVYALVLSPDGKRILSCSLDGTARLWDMATGREITQFTGHAGPVYAVAFAPDGSILTGGKDRTIRRWPATGGESVVLFAGAPE